MKGKRGFSLLECSYLIIIAGIISASYMGIQLAKIEKQKAQITEKKMEKIQESLKAHVFFEGRLPCPAKMVAATDSNFGKESQCRLKTATDIKELKATDKSRAGYIPVEALNLPVEYSYDGWGNFIKYIIHTPFTEESSFKQTSDQRLSIKHQSELIKDTGYILMSSGKDSYGAKKWPDNKSSSKQCDNIKSNSLIIIMNIAENCKLEQDKIHSDSDGKMGQFIKWDTFNDLLQIQENWNLNRDNPVNTTDHIINSNISDNNANNLLPGIYLIKANTFTEDKLKEWNIFPLNNQYSLVRLRKNFSDQLTGQLIKNDDFQENDIIFRKNHGYYVLNNTNEWIFLNNNLTKNDEIFASVDNIMNTTFIANDGIYLLQKDTSNLADVKTVAMLHKSCRFLKKGDIVKIEDSKCFFINNLETTDKQMVYVKHVMQFLQLKVNTNGTKEWIKKYEVRENTT